MTNIKLIAMDTEDLSVLSAHLQDAVVRIGDIAFDRPAKRFAAVLNRFDWDDASKKKGRKYQRRQSGMRFERVLKADIAGINLTNKDDVLSLLAVSFEPLDEPSGHITLLFSGGAAIRLKVECIEVELKDLGAVWQTRNKPSHPDEDA
jgi:Protein of unknown function (DUF2948)